MTKLKQLELGKIEEKPADNQALIRSMVESMSEGVIMVNGGGRVVVINPAAKELLGLKDEDHPESNNLVELLKGSDLAELSEDELLESGNARTQRQIRITNPRESVLDTSISAIKDAQGRVIGRVLTLRDITEKKRAEEKLQQNYYTQTVINSLLHLSLQDISLEDLLKRALNLILFIPWLSFESRGAIFLVEDDSEVLVMKSQNGLSEPIKKACARVPFGRCFCGWAALTQEIQFGDHRDDRHETCYEGITPHAHCCVPILFEGGTLGVINIYLKEGHLRDQREEEFLTAVANTVAGLMVRRRTGEQLQQSFENLQKAIGWTIQVVASTVESRDPYTAGHQKRVTNLASAIAAEMGLSKDQIDGIRMAGAIHDLGKMSVPAEILSKPGRITEHEFRLIKSHPKVGYDILKTIEFPWPIAQIVLQHHERMDGSGYPQGLSGEDIILEARILGVADVVEAMSSRRPYREPLGIDKALEEISEKKGTLYDPRVVDTCVKLFIEKGFKFEQIEGMRLST